MSKLIIKEVIKSRGLTVAQVAGKMSILPSALSQSINGNPSFDKLCEIAEAIGCEVSELIDSGSNVITCPHCGSKIRVKVEE